MSLQDVINFLNASLECSVYHAPKEPGLSYDEIQEIGKRAGFQPGEIGDALPRVTTQYFGVPRLMPGRDVIATWSILILLKNPDYRNVNAFDFVYSQLNDLVRSVGAASALIERDVVVERAVARNLPRLDVEAAITISILTGQITEKNGHLSFTSGGEHLPLPSQQRNQVPGHANIRRDESRERVYQIVKDVITRRTDGRPKHAEPLDAFAEKLNPLGYEPFRLWWMQTVAELRHSNPQSSSVSVLVLAAALVEGALTFVVRHARDSGLGVFRSKNFDGHPMTWKIDDLVKSAATGSDTAILDAPTRQRADRLIHARQRIHAGRMLSEFPRGVPDLRPEEARDAKATADEVVRRVLDWLEKYPPRLPKP
jgi:hypothetical protein